MSQMMSLERQLEDVQAEVLDMEKAMAKVQTWCVTFASGHLI
jgi:hypothetical protein